LVHDDIVDAGEIRRGLPSLWKRYEDLCPALPDALSSGVPLLAASRQYAYGHALLGGDMLYVASRRALQEAMACLRSALFSQILPTAEIYMALSCYIDEIIYEYESMEQSTFA
jgi:geranylgeranyl pyrophosphate synthase